jgi:hypothetical protein
MELVQGHLMMPLAIFGFVYVIIGLLASIFWLWMLIDCLMSNLPPVEKVLWFLVIFLLHVLGALIYFIVRRPGGRRLTT